MISRLKKYDYCRGGGLLLHSALQIGELQLMKQTFDLGFRGEEVGHSAGQVNRFRKHGLLRLVQVLVSPWISTTADKQKSKMIDTPLQLDNFIFFPFL